MAILDESDLYTYVSNADADEASIFLAQSTIEAWLGFPIEKAERIEILQLTTRSKTAQLSYVPIASSPIPVLEVRQGNERDRLDRQSVVTDWVTLQSGDYVLDPTGLISLNTRNSTVSFGLTPNHSTELRATYTAGLDFSQDTAEINALKAAAGRIITYQCSSNFNTGVIEVEIKNQSRKRWASNSLNQAESTNGVPNSFFSAFQKYKPRTIILAG
ncbi:MAG: hypothetical protein F6K11_18870 [Leptolyngbya sp. SIO3F4]|nr:hypothetical protein [Leptolyngbya sp. SIO3F4]